MWINKVGFGHFESFSFEVHLFNEAIDEGGGVLVEGEIDGLDIIVLLLLGFNALVEHQQSHHLRQQARRIIA